MFYGVYTHLYTNLKLHKESYHGIGFIVESLILSTVPEARVTTCVC